MIKRSTIQRAMVLEAVQQLHCHATADEVYDQVAQLHPSVSRGTVYRNLKRLSEEKQIRRVAIPDGADRYDHQCFDHYHVCCVRCGRVADVDMAYMTGLENAVRDAQGFSLTGHDIIFQGICPDCMPKH